MHTYLRFIHYRFIIFQEIFNISNKIIQSNIKNLSQLLDDGLILFDKQGIIILLNSMAKQFRNKKLNKKNISDFIYKLS